MATIVTGYNKTGAMLILDPRERLIYPFNFGSYSEIRMGMFWSLTPVVSGDNGNMAASDLTTSPSAVLQKQFIGFCNYDTGRNMPLQGTGYDFIGIVGGLSGDNNCGYDAATTILKGGDVGNAIYFSVTMIDGSGNNARIGTLQTSPAIVLYATTTPTGGDLGYASFFGLKLLNSGNNKAIKAFSDSNIYIDNASASISSLRTKISNEGTTPGLQFNGLFVSGFAGSNTCLTPNAFFINNHMLNTRFRIHALAVEKYA